MGIAMNVDWPSVFSRVKAALMRRGRSEQDADDFVQDAYVRMASYGQTHPVEQPEAFLMKTALNLSIDAHRLSVTRGEQVVLEDVVLLDGQPGVEDVLLSRERLARLSECISALDDQTREILLASRIEGLTYEEIGRRHGMSINTVHKLIAKALLLVAGKMQGWYP